jgi:excisionase family DNA binding protein
MPPTWEESAARETNNASDRRSSASGGTVPRDRRKSPPRSGEPLWTVAQVAAYLQASRSWVYHQSECGRLPSLRIGGLLRFSPAAVRAYALAIRNEKP